jgi:hypothetical protein
MKTIKTVKLKATKTATKVSTAKVPAAIRPSGNRAKDTAPAMASTTTPPAAAAVAAPRREITTELIAARAYIIWEQQGRPHGRDMANWLLAESQLKQEVQSLTA